MPYVIEAADREAFRRCRRAWNFGAGARENYEPVRPDPSRRFARALRDALGVYYFPGMWQWNRAIVHPLVQKAFARAMERGRGTEAGGAFEAQLDAGRELLERYFEWGPETDRFAPLRVGTELEVTIPDASRVATDLTTASGEPIHYRGRIDLLVQEEDGTHWLVHHLLGGERWATADDLANDGRGRALCWAWEGFFLGMTISGTIYNELRDAASFRRTVVARDRAELAGVHAEIARDALQMTSPSVVSDPRFARGICSRCEFQRPCIAMSERRDLEEILSVAYRKREHAEAELPRLGEMQSGMGRALFVREKMVTR